jgi:hypothetical protein
MTLVPQPNDCFTSRQCDVPNTSMQTTSRTFRWSPPQTELRTHFFRAPPTSQPASGRVPGVLVFVSSEIIVPPISISICGIFLSPAFLDKLTWRANRSLMIPSCSHSCVASYLSLPDNPHCINNRLPSSRYDQKLKQLVQQQVPTRHRHGASLW